MSRSARTLVVFFASIVVAGVFSALVYQAGRRAPANAEVQSYAVAVAARTLPVGSRLTATDVKLVAWPASSPVPGAVTRLEDAVNRGLLAPVVENEPLTAAKLANADTGAGLPPRITTGMRAISVKVDDVVGVAGFAVPGAHVDVVVTMTQREQSVARVVVSNVEVLASGTRAEQTQTIAAARQSPNSVVTLLVSPADAERISLAASVGRITLTLRNPLDTTTTETKGTQVASLLGAPEPAPAAAAPASRSASMRVVKAAPPEPPPPPPPPYTVETIRAAKRTAEVVK